jgi:hypothetical protein
MKILARRPYGPLRSPSRGLPSRVLHTKWTTDCDRRLHRLICYIHTTKHYRMVGWVGDPMPTDRTAPIHADADSAGCTATPTLYARPLPFLDRAAHLLPSFRDQQTSSPASATVHPKRSSLQQRTLCDRCGLTSHDPLGFHPLYPLRQHAPGQEWILFHGT